MTLKKLYWRWRLRKEPVPEGFDGDWYRNHYRDVAMAGVDPLLHYLRFGRREGRDPNPDFSASGYCLVCPEAASAADPLIHYHAEGRAAGYSPRPELEGEQPYRDREPTLMVCAHQAGLQLYGAERSLLDVLAGLNVLGANLVVTLPSALNTDYVNRIRSLAWRVVILPYGWWRRGRAPVAATLGHFERLLKDYPVDALYANTLVLDEPLLAARKRGVPVAVHVRELPAHDAALCDILGATPADISARLRELVDVPVTNSTYTAQSLDLEDVIVVPNSIEVANFDGLELPVDRGEPLTVGMISSNIPKKGVNDFVALARVLKSAAPEVRCRLIGPENKHIRTLRAQQTRGEVPDNLNFAGYAETPRAALAQLDVLVNLSHFQESFGRTVLEAMAAGRPVVAYEWGALPELVAHEKTGYLVPLGNVQAVADCLTPLARDPQQRRALGQAGRSRAATVFGREARQAGLQRLLASVYRPR